MKRVLILIASALACCACQEDVIAITEDPVDTTIIDNDDSTDPDEAEGDGDLIAGVTFGRTIGIVWNGSSASVTGDEHGVVAVNGAGVTVDNRSYDEIVRFELSGSSSNGYLKIYGKRKQALVLKGLDLTNKSGSSITGTAYSSSSWSKGATHVVCDESGNAVFAFKTPSSSGTMVVYVDGKSASVKSGVTISDGSAIWGGNGWSSGTATGGSKVNLSTYSGGGGRW